ncbi:hypothetical protein EWE75_12175 [Sphingomonas populi]|uniref:TerB family tellurite resistance protein n=1 Tax=Sphingomonas populi TaxID=2484750 RepID=A0A4Q6Y546_9SPHN|nr:hypothetical protein [Sphingomonas populi]RZF64296.1 hypothetical protein EWE75_12175 [Sphingomonas populi]
MNISAVDALMTKRAGVTSALPKVPAGIVLTYDLVDEASAIATDIDDEDDQPITAFVCIIDYQGEIRLITCRRFDIIGENGYVGAICHVASGYRQFRCDRIGSVADAVTGEILGDGSYFNRYAPTTKRAPAATWGLTPARKSHLVAGLTVLAFMARCDGVWHPLETESIEAFICSMWMRKEWEGDPPVVDIINHAQRLSPTSGDFFRALERYVGNKSSAAILRNAVRDLICADGVICDAESGWALELDSFLADQAGSHA